MKRNILSNLDDTFLSTKSFIDLYSPDRSGVIRGCKFDMVSDENHSAGVELTEEEEEKLVKKEGRESVIQLTIDWGLRVHDLWLLDNNIIVARVIPSIIREYFRLLDSGAEVNRESYVNILNWRVGLA